MDTVGLPHAVSPCHGVPAAEHEVYTAPVLPLPATDKEHPVPNTPVITAQGHRQRASSRTSRSLCAKASGCPA